MCSLKFSSSAGCIEDRIWDIDNNLTEHDKTKEEKAQKRIDV